MLIQLVFCTPVRGRDPQCEQSFPRGFSGRVAYVSYGDRMMSGEQGECDLWSLEKFTTKERSVDGKFTESITGVILWICDVLLRLRLHLL